VLKRLVAGGAVSLLLLLTAGVAPLWAAPPELLPLPAGRPEPIRNPVLGVRPSPELTVGVAIPSYVLTLAPPVTTQPQFAVIATAARPPVTVRGPSPPSADRIQILVTSVSQATAALAPIGGAAPQPRVTINNAVPAPSRPPAPPNPPQTRPVVHLLSVIPAAAPATSAPAAIDKSLPAAAPVTASDRLTAAAASIQTVVAARAPVRAPVVTAAVASRRQSEAPQPLRETEIAHASAAPTIQSQSLPLDDAIAGSVEIVPSPSGPSSAGTGSQGSGPSFADLVKLLLLCCFLIPIGELASTLRRPASMSYAPPVPPG
jgi:hypothetical protein